MGLSGSEKKPPLDPLFQLLSNPHWLQSLHRQEFDPNPDISFEAFQIHVSAVSTGWDAALKLVPSRIAALKRHYNTLLPLHRLPIEILSEIFRASLLPKQGQKDHFLDLSHLMRVCTSWKEVVKETPRF